MRRDYCASDGWETFLAYEDPKQDILVGLLRLRRCSDATFRPELRAQRDDDSEPTHHVQGSVEETSEPSDGVALRTLAPDAAVSIVRELHVYGSAVPVHSRDPAGHQHKGYGTLLMEEAERIARDEHGSSRIAVISGVGVRQYYRRLGYTLLGPYMVKDLDEE